ncbi:hypothetical protein, partial [Klebsiella variicola]|uniref:hypothetical protein n=1 Tax=Klebsiella variicola TaxID=244366 RepID=UPI00272F9995
AIVEGRPKHYWSIYQKMIVKGRDFDDIHDLVGVRILCEEVRDCYAAVGVVHSLWQPMAGRFKVARHTDLTRATARRFLLTLVE